MRVGDKKGKADVNLITIRGIVIPVDWDEKGKVVGVAISTFDEDEYVVERGEKGAELKRFIRQEVEISGILKRGENSQIITIKEIHP